MAKHFQKRKETDPEKNGRKKGVERRIFFFYLLAACLMFVLGIYVGRGTAPFQYDIPNIELRLQEVLTGLEKETLQKKDDLGFYDQLKVDTAELPPEEIAGEVKGEVGTGTTTTSRPVKTILSRSSSEKKRMPEKGAELAVSPPENRDTPDARTSTGSGQAGKWTIQIAAFSSQEEAALAVNKYKQKGYDAYLVESRSDSGKTWYRFRVGKFTDRNTANAVRNKLVADGARDAYIVQDN